jgi:hypothetical protein
MLLAAVNSSLSLSLLLTCVLPGLLCYAAVRLYAGTRQHGLYTLCLLSVLMCCCATVLTAVHIAAVLRSAVF